jgi:hypothetical protein
MDGMDGIYGWIDRWMDGIYGWIDGWNGWMDG